jgi:hypothetical protein
VREVREVPLSFRSLAEALLDPAAAWLTYLAERPVTRPRHGPHEPGAPVAGAAPCAPVPDSQSPRSVAVRVGVGRQARLPVLVSIGTPRARRGSVVVPVRWDPIMLDHLLPALDGDIDLRAGEDGARLGIEARYRAPFGEAGRALDRLALRRVAGSSVRDFLERVEAAVVATAKLGPQELPHSR